MSGEDANERLHVVVDLPGIGAARVDLVHWLALQGILRHLQTKNFAMDADDTAALQAVLRDIYTSEKVS